MAGVGLGVFLTIIALIIGILVCIIGTATPCFLIMFILGILIPLITFLVVALAPLHSDNEEKTDRRIDNFIIARIIFLVIMVLSGLLSIMSVINFYFGINLKTRRVDSRITGAALADLLELENNPVPNSALNQERPVQGDGLEMQPIREEPQYQSRGDFSQGYDNSRFSQDRNPQDYRDPYQNSGFPARSQAGFQRDIREDNLRYSRDPRSTQIGQSQSRYDSSNNQDSRNPDINSRFY